MLRPVDTTNRVPENVSADRRQPGVLIGYSWIRLVDTPDDAPDILVAPWSERAA